MTDEDKFIEDIKGAEIKDFGPCEGGGRHIGLRKDGYVAMGHGRWAKEGENIQPGECLLQSKDGKIIDGYAMAAGTGPAQVATPEYRENYESIFGKKSESELN